MIFTAHNIFYSVGGTSILENLNFSIPQESFVTIIGPNGAGKSTLLKILARILPPSQGQVLFENTVYASLSHKCYAQKVSYLPQFFSPSFALKVTELVLLGRYPYRPFFGLDSKRDYEIGMHSLELTKCFHLANRYFHTLSGGEKQRVLLAKCLTQQTKTLLLDEPTTHLDLAHKIEFLNLLKNLKIQFKLNIIMTTHDIFFMKEYTDYFLFLKKGNIFLTGNKNMVFKKENLISLFSMSQETKRIFLGQQNEFDL
ncbi:MAG TPA: ABC transporter ATP-binding protein [Bdellovibrionota bacterium]|nr:ABC transporter ATP-binding protein [Bdellovibrionota bacterium]